MTSLLTCLLAYLLAYLLTQVDTSNDRRINLEEFRDGAAALAKLGVHLSQHDVDAEFARIDANHGGPDCEGTHQSWALCGPHAHQPWAPCDPHAHQPWAHVILCLTGLILFDEFVNWALGLGVELGEHDDAPEDVDLPPPPPPPPPVKPPPRPASTFAGAKIPSPRPTSAQASPGSVGWRGGGSSARARSSAANPDEQARRQQAQEAVAQSAAKAFARALPPAPPPPNVLAAGRQQALVALHDTAQRQAGAALSLDQLEARAWHAQNNKIAPNADFVTSPRARHVPAAHDPRLGAPTHRTLIAETNAKWNKIMTNGGSAVDGGQKAVVGVPSDGYVKDDRTWRCQRCHVMQRPASTTCTSCTRPRANATRR